MEPKPTLDQLWKLAEERLNRGDVDGAKTACQSLLQLDPLNSRAHLMLGDICGQQDQHRLATAHALQAAAKMGKQSLQHIAAVSLRLIAVGEYEQAVGMIRKLDPAALPAPAFLVEFSQQLSLLEQHEEALRFMDAAIRVGVKAESVGYLRGNYLKFLGRLDEAAVEYERSLASNPNFAYAHWALGLPGHARQPCIARRSHSQGHRRHGRRQPGHRLTCTTRCSRSSTPSATPMRPGTALESGFRSKRARVSYDARGETALFDQLASACATGLRR